MPTLFESVVVVSTGSCDARNEQRCLHCVIMLEQVPVLQLPRPCTQTVQLPSNRTPPINAPPTPNPLVQVCLVVEPLAAYPVCGSDTKVCYARGSDAKVCAYGDTVHNRSALI